MNIEVGIYETQKPTQHKNAVDPAVGWKIVCEQEKVPWRATDRPDCPVIVCEGDTPAWLADFMAEGGVGIVTGAQAHRLPFAVETVGDASIEYVDLGELGGSAARVQCTAEIFAGEGLGTIALHENRIKKWGISPDEYPVFVFHPYGRGGCWYTGLPLSRLMGAQGDTLRKIAPFSEFSERIVSVDKHVIARAMRNLLVKAFHLRGLPYVHLGYYPKDYQSVFTFRIDVDGVFGANLVRVSEQARQNGVAVTFFVNQSLCQPEEGEILKIDAMHEIGNHANIHNLFPDYEANYRNVLECKQWLDQLGVKNGLWFAAPRGMWNPSLHRALEDLGYLYTSDFGAGIDGWPFFPYIQGKRSSTLQIPVNPFSVERACVWQSEAPGREITPEFVAEFWGQVIETKSKQGYPIMLYSHPEKFGAMAGEVFAQIQRMLAGRNIWKTTVSEFARWWNRRDRYRYSADYDLSTGQVTISGAGEADISVQVVSA